MGKAIIIAGADFSTYKVGVVKFEGKEIFEQLLLHKWDLDSNSLDTIAGKTLVDLNSGALSISSGLTVNSGQKIYAALTDNLDTDNDGITVAFQLMPVTEKSTSPQRIVYLCMTTNQAFTGTNEVCLVSEHETTYKKFVVKKGGSEQFFHGTVKINTWQNVVITFKKNAIKVSIDNEVSAEVAPSAGTNPMLYSIIYLGCYWTSGSNVADAHKIKNVRIYKKYMTNNEITLLNELMETL